MPAPSPRWAPPRPIALVGAGDMGHALARYQGFANRGFNIVMVFDNDPEKIGEKIDPFVIEDSAHLVEKIRSAGIKMAMLTVPAASAQDVAGKLVQAGVKCILNYAPIHLVVPEGVRVQHIDPAIHLQRMTYYL